MSVRMLAYLRGIVKRFIFPLAGDIKTGCVPLRNTLYLKNKEARFSTNYIFLTQHLFCKKSQKRCWVRKKIYSLARALARYFLA